jgi:methanol metabolism-related c-type cytochrome
LRDFKTLSRASACAAALALLAIVPAAFAEPAKAVREEEGKHFTADDTPTYSIKADGTVDWYTFSGYRRYHAECHTCHGPDGMGSTYAPSLVDSLKRLSHADFNAVVIQGRQNVGGGKESVMPSFGTNNNVACYLDDIYIYLKARSDGALARVRPAKRAEKPEAAKQAEKTCLGES